MRYAPYESEYLAVPSMSDGELLDYFLFRTIETEEVWGLHEQADWLLREHQGQITLPIWPYKRFALEAALEHWHDGTPGAISLEHFVFKTLQQLIEAEVMVEIMPRGTELGCLITPHRLLDILTGILDAGECRLDD